MITTPTTFVIGAGGSCQYGLSASAGLIRAARALTPGDHLYQLLLGITRTDPAEVNSVLEDLRQHPAGSIDAFLESRQSNAMAMKIGRHLIALLLAREIQNTRNGQLHGASDWLGYIIERMRRGAPTSRDFANGNSAVRFVTFNFDTLIEQRLEAAIRAIYRGEPESQLAGAAEVICRVIHVHGRLPQVPQVPLFFDTFQGYDPAWGAWLPNAADEIRVVLDDIDQGIVRAARDVVANSKILCFLGFAYDPTNLLRLNLPGAFATAHHMTVYGAAYGLSLGEQAWVKGKFLNQIELGSTTQDCYEVLRHFHIFRD